MYKIKEKYQRRITVYLGSRRSYFEENVVLLKIADTVLVLMDYNYCLIKQMKSISLIALMLLLTTVFALKIQRN